MPWLPESAPRRSPRNLSGWMPSQDEPNSGLPNFLIVGAQKSGTTWLHHNLTQHPQVYLPRAEIHFFSDRERHSRGPDWYRTVFATAGGAVAVGERSPDYLWTGNPAASWDGSRIPSRIHALIPRTRLIVVLRDPVARAISAMGHLLRSGRLRPTRSLDAFLVGSEQHLVAKHGVIERGYYHRQIQDYLQYFPRRSMQVLVFEDDILRAPLQTLRSVCEFLEVDPAFAFQGAERRQNKNESHLFGIMLTYYFKVPRRWTRALGKYLPGGQQTVSAEARRKLAALYSPENEALFSWLGRRIDSWTNVGGLI